MEYGERYWLLPHARLHPALVGRLFTVIEELAEDVRGTANFWVDDAEVIVPRDCLVPLRPEEEAAARYLLSLDGQEDDLPATNIHHKLIRHGRLAWRDVRYLQSQVQLAGGLFAGMTVLDYPTREALVAALLRPPNQQEQDGLREAWKAVSRSAKALTVLEAGSIRTPD